VWEVGMRKKSKRAWSKSTVLSVIFKRDERIVPMN